MAEKAARKVAESKGGGIDMTIEVALVISALSLAFGIYQGVTDMKRNRTADDKNDATHLITVVSAPCQAVIIFLLSLGSRETGSRF